MTNEVVESVMKPAAAAVAVIGSAAATLRGSQSLTFDFTANEVFEDSTDQGSVTTFVEVVDDVGIKDSDCVSALNHRRHAKMSSQLGRPHGRRHSPQERHPRRSVDVSGMSHSRKRSVDGCATPGTRIYSIQRHGPSGYARHGRRRSMSGGGTHMQNQDSGNVNEDSRFVGRNGPGVCLTWAVQPCVESDHESIPETIFDNQALYKANNGAILFGKEGKVGVVTHSANNQMTLLGAGDGMFWRFRGETDNTLAQQQLLYIAGAYVLGDYDSIRKLLDSADGSIEVEDSACKVSVSKDDIDGLSVVFQVKEFDALPYTLEDQMIMGLGLVKMEEQSLRSFVPGSVIPKN